MAADERSPVAIGLRCRCPQCGRGKLFAGLLTVRERCEVCGLDLRAHDSGDGPAAFLILILGEGHVRGFFVLGQVALWIAVISALVSAADYSRRINVIMGGREA